MIVRKFRKWLIKVIPLWFISVNLKIGNLLMVTSQITPSSPALRRMNWRIIIILWSLHFFYNVWVRNSMGQDQCYKKAPQHITQWLSWIQLSKHSLCVPSNAKRNCGKWLSWWWKKEAKWKANPLSLGSRVSNMY